MSFDTQIFLSNMEKAAQIIPQLIDKSSQIPQEASGAHTLLMQEIASAFAALNETLLKQDPTYFSEWGMQWWQQSLAISQQHFQGFLEDDSAAKEGEKEAKPQDRRFRHELWSSNPFYENLRQQYQLAADSMEAYIAKATGVLDTRQAQLVQFGARQWQDALSPSNYPWSNPEVLQQALETEGESLVSGLENLLHDIERGRISMVPDAAFELGKTLATTPGSVVYENELMQLIHYAPATKTVHETPILLVPAWINKYYILDLQPQNSLVKWLVDQGYSVFIVSWVNPDASLHHIGLDDYLTRGAWQAVQVVNEICGTAKTHIAGYCLGGTLVNCLLAWLHAQNKADCIASASFLTTLTDFKQAGDLCLFIDPAQLESLEETLNRRGYLEGAEMASIFNLLRPKDLIWSFVINNYLLGNKPMVFDLLYWNSDVTRMPARMHLEYLRNMYLENRLIEAGGLNLAGQPLDLGRIKTPTYMLSTQEDHIAPWQATYSATQLYQGKCRFVLSGSGHIAGVINPPAKAKYFWRSADSLPASAEDWLAASTQQEGSWWGDWDRWLQQQQGEGKRISPRSPGSHKRYPTLEAAPGSYVRVKA